MLTKRQKQILVFIEACVDRDGCPPTIREIGKRFGIKSPNGVIYHLNKLEYEGAIDRGNTSKARCIRVVNRRKKTCPHCGGEL